MKKTANNFLTIFLSGFIFFICLFYCAHPVLSADFYKFKRLWPTLEQPWYFYWPRDIATDPDGYVYIADTSNNRIQKFTADGHLVTSWGTKGSEEGKFELPGGIASDIDSFIYVMDTGNHRIQKFNANGQFIRAWGNYGFKEGEFNDQTHGIASDHSGHIYISDKKNNRIQKFTSDGKFLTAWGNTAGGGNLSWPEGIALDTNGTVYVADLNNNRIVQFTSEGKFIDAWEKGGGRDFDFPVGIAVDGAGSVYITDLDSHQICKLDSRGNLLSTWGEQGSSIESFRFPRGLCIYDHYLYVADQKNNRIQKLTIDGHFLSSWGISNTDGIFNAPKGMISDADDFIYIVDSGNHRIQKFKPDMEFDTAWGKEGHGDGEFQNPYGIAVDSEGKIYVTDSSNDRVQKFHPNGQYITQWTEFGNTKDGFISPKGIAIDDNNIVYVADTGNNRICLFDTDGNYLKQVGSDLMGNEDGEFSNPYGVAVNQADEVYVVDTLNHRIQQFDAAGQFITKWGTEGSDPGKFKSPEGLMIDSGGNVYVTDGGNHRIQKFTSTGDYISEWGEEGSAPGQMRWPAAIMINADGEIYVSDSDNHRIQLFKQISSDLNQKAVIVAGGGAYPGNKLWDATRMSANFAYHALTYQGFSKDQIYYLSTDRSLDLDGNGEPDDVDDDPTYNTMQYAIEQWAADADHLVIYLVDHGGENKFRLNQAGMLSTADLDAMLDVFQGSALKKVTVIYDACNSGSMIEKLQPPGQYSRIVITSTSTDEDAYFITQGSISFSGFFWTHVFNGENVQASFDKAVQAIGEVTDFQHPILTVYGDVDPDEFYIGNGTQIAGDAPVIEGIFSDTTIIETSSTDLYVEKVMDDDGVAHVWAIITPPDYANEASDQPLLDLPSVDLLPIGGGRYEGSWDQFNIEGTYNVAVYARDRLGNTSMPALSSVSVNTPMRRKAVIIVNGDLNGGLWPLYQNNAALAYQSLQFQGYDDEDIYFLSPVTFSGGVDGTPVVSNLKFAFETWAMEEAQDLIVYLTGEAGLSGFLLYDSDVLAASGLDAWMDALQQSILGTVTIVYDADYAGSFLPLLLPPEGKKRIVIAGTSADAKAVFLPDGGLSFSSFFWKHVSDGADIRTAFLESKNAISFFSGSSSDKTPQLDDTGNGIGNERSDGNLAMNVKIGAGIRRAGNDPVVGTVPPDIVLTGETDTNIRVDDVTSLGTIQTVWAVIVPPGGEFGEITDNIVEFAPLIGRAYEGRCTGFSSFGNYQVAVYAKDADNNISLARTVRVYQSRGSDIYEPDNIRYQAKLVSLNHTTPQHHNFHNTDDEDWLRFFGMADQVYSLKAGNQETNCKARIEVYDTAMNLLKEAETPTGERDLILDWQCEKNGIYYVRVLSSESLTNVQDTGYEFEIYRPIGPFMGYLKGTVVDASTGAPIPQAIIQTGAGATDLSRSSGRYLMIQEPGQSDLHVEASGYITTSVSVEIGEGGTTVVNVELQPIAVEPPDYCPNDPNKTFPGICGCGILDVDSDGDGIFDCHDGCPNDPNKTDPGICECGKSDVDTDKDGTPDCNDECPDDADKTEPGVCGCGIPDIDEDNDGITDCLFVDQCPDDPDKTDPGICGCGVPDVDEDGDGIMDCLPGCPDDPDKTDPGICGCGVSDIDSDGDGVPDCIDNCPDDAEKVDPGVCKCGEVDKDTDGDGTLDCHDLCFNDPNKINPGICGCDISDTDTDSDGIPDCYDNQPPDQPNLLYPANQSSDIPLTTVFRTHPFSDPDNNENHRDTLWEISLNSDLSSLVFQLDSTSQLTALSVPKLVLKHGTSYYWRVRFTGSTGETSEWSESGLLTTINMLDNYDANTNGIPDDKEVSHAADLDENSIPDHDQQDIKSIQTAAGDSRIGVKTIDNISSIEVLEAFNPETDTYFNSSPGNTPLGAIAFRLMIDEPDKPASIVVHFSNPVPEDAAWYIFNPFQGWQGYAGYAEFDETLKSAHIKFTDGGYGDADGVKNGIIVHTAAVVVNPVDYQKTAHDFPRGDVGGVGCFINTTFTEKLN